MLAPSPTLPRGAGSVPPIAEPGAVLEAPADGGDGPLTAASAPPGVVVRGSASSGTELALLGARSSATAGGEGAAAGGGTTGAGGGTTAGGDAGGEAEGGGGAAGAGAGGGGVAGAGVRSAGVDGAGAGDARMRSRAAIEAGRGPFVAGAASLRAGGSGRAGASEGSGACVRSTKRAAGSATRRTPYVAPATPTCSASDMDIQTGSRQLTARAPATRGRHRRARAARLSRRPSPRR